MRPIGPFDVAAASSSSASSPLSIHNDCVLIVGVSRPKLAVVFLTIMLFSLFFTFHVLYDSAVYSIQVSHVLLLLLLCIVYGGVILLYST